MHTYIWVTTTNPFYYDFHQTLSLRLTAFLFRSRSSSSALTASYGRLADKERLEWLARWPGDDHNATARAGAVWASLAAYDVVGTTERYDE